MQGRVSEPINAIYDIMITDADGQHLRLESFLDLESATRRFPLLAALYPGTKLMLWNRDTRAVLAETEGY